MKMQYNERSIEKVNFLRLLLLLLLCLAEEIGADNNLAVNKSAPDCKVPRIPLLCDRKLLRYAYDATTGNCVSLYTNGCAPAAMTKHFLTFEECRRDRMQILRY